MKNKVKKNNKRTKEEREAELDGPLNQLVLMRLDNDLEGVKNFYETVEDFIEFGNPFTGIIKVPELKREFQCLLSNYKKNEITIVFANSKNH